MCAIRLTVSAACPRSSKSQRTLASATPNASAGESGYMRSGWQRNTAKKNAVPCLSSGSIEKPATNRSSSRRGSGFRRRFPTSRSVVPITARTHRRRIGSPACESIPAVVVMSIAIFRLIRDVRPHTGPYSPTLEGQRCRTLGDLLEHHWCTRNRCAVDD